MKVLVTGAGGFIGFHTSKALLDRGHHVVGLDNLNSYYDVNLKRARLARISGRNRFRFVHASLEDGPQLHDVFRAERFDRVVNLAAQAGVRYSIDHPRACIDSNIVGFLNVLECCRHFDIDHLVYASSSSVYGANTSLPFCVHDNVDHPLSLYAATKKSNELMAHSYSALYGLPVTGLRFFTVYGPWGRPDMSLFLFTSRILNGEPIDIFNHGRHERDFTYIDDIVEGIIRTLEKTAERDAHWSGDAPDPATSFAPYRIYNIGNNKPVPLMSVIACLERTLACEAKKNFLDLQPGDVPRTCADIEALADAVDFRPRIGIEEGIGRFVTWYREYYHV